MRLFSWIYRKIMHKKPPYYLNYSVITLFLKPVRKWLTNVVASNCPFNCIRIFIYRMCGFKIGKNVFIGMHCYLDDMCYKYLTIGNNTTISYGVYFACHGRKQGHESIEIRDNVYIGMRASVISKNADNTKKGVVIGDGALIGACTLVNKDIPPNSKAVGTPCRVII